MSIVWIKIILKFICNRSEYLKLFKSNLCKTVCYDVWWCLCHHYFFWWFLQQILFFLWARLKRLVIERVPYIVILYTLPLNSSCACQYFAITEDQSGLNSNWSDLSLPQTPDLPQVLGFPKVPNSRVLLYNVYYIVFCKMRLKIWGRNCPIWCLIRL